jgi:hypothetical protein
VLVGTRQNFTGKPGGEAVSARRQFSLQLGAVGDRAVERDGDAGLLVVERLAEHHAVPAFALQRVDAAACGAMRERLQHAADRVFVGRVASRDPAGKRAHVTRLS